MQERFAEIATPNGRIEAFVAHPEEGGPCPAILVYTDVDLHHKQAANRDWEAVFAMFHRQIPVYSA